MFALHRSVRGSGSQGSEPRLLTDGQVPLRPPHSAFMPKIVHLFITRGLKGSSAGGGLKPERTEKGFVPIRLILSVLLSPG